MYYENERAVKLINWYAYCFKANLLFGYSKFIAEKLILEKKNSIKITKEEGRTLFQPSDCAYKNCPLLLQLGVTLNGSVYAVCKHSECLLFKSHYNKSKIRQRCNEELRFVPYMVYKSGPAEIRNSQINFIVERNELQSIRSSYG